MRLHETQRAAIKKIVADTVGADSRVLLFGSRVDDAKRGGDIDLMIETDHVIANRVALLCKLEGRSAMALGDRKVDVLLKDPRTPKHAPIYQTASDTGILL